MKFLHPLGLLGLIGVPILIIIYIIKSKYAEQTVTSTYIWTLSEKFIKRRNPFANLAGLISLILQILLVIIISLAIARPIFIVEDEAHEYCFVLDGSASMNMTVTDDEGEPITRFELGKRRIEEIIDSSVDGSIFTVIYMGNESEVLCERLSSKDRVKTYLSEAVPTQRAIESTDALLLAQSYFDENSSALTYFVTDTEYESIQNLQVIDVSGDSTNTAISNVTHVFVNDTLTVTGTVISYDSDKEITLELFVDGQAESVSSEVYQLIANEPQEFTLSSELTEYSSVRVAISEDDSLLLDSEMLIFNQQSKESHKVLIVSDNGFMLNAMLESILDAQIDLISPEEYENQVGYGLYIFDSFSPTSAPTDGAVWLINVTESVSDFGFSYRSEHMLEQADVLELSASTKKLAKELRSDLLMNEIYITKYLHYGTFRDFAEIYTYNGLPMIFAGTTSKGGREVVFAFDLNDSNLMLNPNFIILSRNLLEYSFPSVVEEQSYYCGDTMDVNVILNCESINVTAPSGKVTNLELGGASASYTFEEAGAHTVTLMVAGAPRQYRVFSSLNEEERAPSVTEESVALLGEATEGGFDGELDPIMVLIICLAVIFAADWMVYCYEKYQLR